MDGMDDEQSVETVTPADPPAWSVPSPWAVASPAIPAPPPPPPPAPAGHGPNRLTAALVVALVVAMATAAWAAFDRLDIHLSKPTLSAAPAPRPSTGPARPGGFSGRPFRPAPSGSAPDIDVNAVAAKVQPGMVDIYTQLSSGVSGAGTGVILTPDGEVLTNNHVIEGATSIAIVLIATGQRYDAIVVGTVPTEDIAVLRIQGAANLPTVPLGKSSSVKTGDPIVALGNAGGVGGTPHTVSGTVQALNQTITATDIDGSHPETLTGLIQIDAPLEPGDSGGPLVNRSGQVVGINTAASATRRFRATGDSVGFAIPIDRATALVAQIDAGQASATVHLGVPGLLGVVMSDQSLSLDPGATSGAAGAATSGVGVAEVMAGSPAASAGVVAGDTLTEVDGQPATTPEAVSAVIKKHRAGDKINFSWTDGSNRRRNATVVLAAGPAD
ncbi:MAG TPA: trypsin-like peptidase domain-containing protein [Acidimicrobiia bacterium]|nr:trypsin-like peptidase domain-containing protein [Acidimicrobiia bacterium]